MKIAVIGLGNMGQPIARNVLQAGYELTVYNRTKQKTEELVTEGAQAADTPRLAAKSADIVITMLADDDSVSTVTFGEDGLLEGLAENGIHISMSTISVEFSEKLAAAHAEKGQFFSRRSCSWQTGCRSQSRAPYHNSRTGGSKASCQASARQPEPAGI
ncbi:hypothetical protein ANABIO4_32890 [Bacillus subtilis]|nr:hypothetical protein ANABIO4_32890 [Bacillus subtilis]